MGIRDWFRNRKGNSSDEKSASSEGTPPASGCGVDGFLLDSPPDREVHERINDLIAKTSESVTNEQIEASVAAFLYLFIDRVELHWAAFARLCWYAEHSVASRTCVDLVRSIYAQTIDPARRYLDDGDFSTILAVTSAPLGWSRANDSTIISAVTARQEKQPLAVEVTRELERFLQRLHNDYGRADALIVQVEVLLGRRIVEKPDPAWANVASTITEEVAAGYRNQEGLFAYVIDQHWEELGLSGDGDGDDPEIIDKVRAQIEKAFTQKTREMSRWPSVTDCDRLTRAFAQIETHRIIALQNGGFTQQDAHARAIEIDLAGESAGRASRGFCYFHGQDVASAVEGAGLMIGFSALENPEETVAVQIANIVVDACRDAGLEVAWNGSTNTRIHLPKIKWQRRITEPTETDIADFLASWSLELRAGATAPDQALSMLSERAGDWFADCNGFGPAILAKLGEHTQQLLAEEHERERLWHDATMNDRIDAALGSLRARGMVVPTFGTTIQDGWGYVGIQATAADRGAVFFHDEDVCDGVEGRGMHLAFGALGTQVDVQEIGREILATLTAYGVDARWSGDAAERIEVLPFEWRKRRFTDSPPVTPTDMPLLVVTSADRTPPSGPESDLRRRFIERGLAVVVPARRTSTGFDLRLSHRLRAAWASLGGAEPGHVCHAGLPVVFVPAGGYFALAAMSARENIAGEETKALLERGARSKSAAGSGS